MDGHMEVLMKKRVALLTLILLMAAAASAGDSTPPSEDAAKIVAAAHLKKGQQFAASGKLESAEKEFTLGLISYEDSSALYLGRGQVRYQQKHYQDAIADFDQYLTRVPSDTKTLFLRGIAKSLLKPEDVTGACADIFAAKTAGLSMNGINGLDKYCKGQPNW
jgi:tetratricopeptide (TPR) repeat protein